MGFFDKFNIDEIGKNEESNTAINFAKAVCSYNFGDNCYYDKESKQFKFRIKNNDSILKNCIPVGIVVNQSDDKLVVSVINLHYLNADPELSTSKVNVNAGLWELFERYVLAFKNKLPNYRKLKKMFVRPVTIYEMELLRDNKGIFVEQMRNISNDKDVDIKFFTKFNSGKTVATKNPTIENKSYPKSLLYRWGPSIDAKTLDRFDTVLFLPVFDIHII